MDGTQGRRVYNVGPHGGSSKLLDHIDLNASGSRKRYDQVFDSQVSQSHENSQEFSNRNYHDSFLSQSQQNIKRSDTEPLKHNQVSFSTQKRGLEGQLKQLGNQLERIDEDRTSLNRSNSKLKQQPPQSNYGQNTNLHHQNSRILNNNLDDIISQSNKLEESVQAPNRLPQRIPGLTQFLTDQHFKKTGVFTKSDKELFKFWKNQVSIVYKLRRQQKQNSTLQPHYTMDQNNTSVNLSNPNALAMSYKSTNLQNNLTQKENAMPVDADKSVNAQYKKYERLYEMDVMYTIQKDLEEEKDEFEKERHKREYEYKQSVDNQIKTQERAEIQWMVEEYYNDLKMFQISMLKYNDEKTKERLISSPSKDWHKQGSFRDTVNPVGDSIDELKNEPQKPTINVDFEKEKQVIEKYISTEQTFMLNLFFMARDLNLTNDPKQLIHMYRVQKEKARLGIIWAKGDEDAEKVIREFFKPERFLKRLTLYYQYKNRLGQCKHLSLFGFYLQLKPRQRLLYLIDWKPIKRQNKDSNLNTSKQSTQQQTTLQKDNELKFHDKVYSVEEIVEEYEQFNKRQNEEIKHKQMKEMEEKEKKHKEKLLSQVFGVDKKKKLEEEFKNRKPEQQFEKLAKPKDKWERGKILLQLKKKFPHDMVLQKMIKEEFKENRVFKYPEEYDQYDDEEDRLCKYRGKTGIETKDLGAGKSLREKFKALDDQELYYLKQSINKERRQEREFDEFMVEKALKYLELKKKRLQGERQTIRQFLSDLYHEALNRYKTFVNEKFPHMTYGSKKNSETVKKSFPSTFKKHFFSLIKSYVRTKNGLKRLRQVPPTFIIPSGKRCYMHDFGCPEGCKYSTLNKKILLRTHIYRRQQKEPHGYRSRVWRRNDFKTHLKKVMMLSSDVENCTFEPEAGSLSKNIELAFKSVPNLQKEGYTNEPDPEAYFQKLGKNFESSHPEVYKAGVLKRARLQYKQGLFEKAMNTLQEGFNIESIKRKCDEHYLAKLKAQQQALKKKQDREAHVKEEQKQGLSMLGRVQLTRDQPENQKKRPEEDWENKKLKPILYEAFDLITIIENRKKEAQKKINQIRKSQGDLKHKMRNFSTYKKSSTRVDLTKGEKAIFRTIMCPLKEKCPKIMKPRWPTSNIKSVTKFGEQCPYAHHPMELRFPESIITKLSASQHTIKDIKSKIDMEKPRSVFKPAGALFNCVGCNNKSGKHIGGPCNLCRYKEMADESSAKFTDSKRKNSLMRSMEKRESVDIKEERKEMKQIMDALDLDNNYTKKFGLLKKACVLFFYGRYNDSFDEIAKAAKIIQDQKEIERQKQVVVEKRWKFKLGLDDGFELPIPIEQIDPSKVDDKFLKKLDMPGVPLSTVKLFIEMVSPQRTEEFTKHQFLNKCVEDFYLQCESAIQDKQDTINKMKKQVEKLDEEADLMDVLGSSPERSPEKGEGIGGSMRIKPKKTKMCPSLIEKGKCPQKKEKKCPFAHNPIELDLIPVENKMKNLNGVILSQSLKLKNMKPIEPWRPAKSGDIEHTHLMDMASKKRKKNGDDEEDEDDNQKTKSQMKKSIFERENIFRKPYDTNE